MPVLYPRVNHMPKHQLGVYEGIIQGRYKRDVSFDERTEILELVESYAPKLREYLLFLKNRK